MTEEAEKDEFFSRVGLGATDMIEAFGEDFAMGVPILAARFIAEEKPLARPPAAVETASIPDGA